MNAREEFQRHAQRCHACATAPLGLCPEAFRLLGLAARLREDGQLALFPIPEPTPPPRLQLARP